MPGAGSGEAPNGAGEPPLTVIVDAANVVGARPDGWWRDRAGAAARLHEDLARLAAGGMAGMEIILVLEGAARAAVPLITPVPGVRVVAASGSGDDEIVSLARAIGGPRLVVTADRELRRRCQAAGAGVTGPGWLYARL